MLVHVVVTWSVTWSVTWLAGRHFVTAAGCTHPHGTSAALRSQKTSSETTPATSEKQYVFKNIKFKKKVYVAVIVFICLGPPVIAPSCKRNCANTFEKG
jgi:hypothetical protein